MRLQPRATWRSFGFSEANPWREEGFTLAYDPGERIFGKKELTILAVRYKQVRCVIGWVWYQVD